MKIEKKEGIDKIKIIHNRKLFWIIIVLIIVLLVIVVYTKYLENYGNNINASNSSCVVDSDCVQASCCHASSCVLKNNALNCSGVRCTQECMEGTLDCGQASCGCTKGKCVVNLRK